VGGDSANGRNLIAGNHHDGVLIDGANNCLVQANWIGLNGLGHPLSNEGNGIVVNGGRTNMIGGSRPGTGNVCSGNALAGILLSTGAVANVLLGNLVGTDAAGVGPAGNGGAGVEAAGALNNQIGGRAAGEANRIAFNRGNGVLVRGDTTAGITISGNSVFGNSGHAINLQPAGEKENRITPNDPFDEDGGPNHLQNAPMITNTTYVSGVTVISGIVGSREENNYRIEVFRNDPYSGYVFGEGQIYGGAIGVLSDSSGRAQFQISLAGDFSNQLFCATATDLATGDTSEFSPALPVLKGVLRIVEARRLGENELISFTTETNRQYRVEWSEMLPGSIWNLVSGASNVTGTGEVVVVSDPLINQPSERFYRIVAMP